MKLQSLVLVGLFLHCTFNTSPLLAQEAQKVPSTTSSSQPNAVTMRFESANDKPLTLSVEVGTGSVRASGVSFGYGYGFGGRAKVKLYETVCTSPCEKELQKGEYRFALTRDDDDDPARVKQPVRFDESLLLRGEYHSRSGIRTVGWILAIGGPIVGAALMFLSTIGTQGGDCDTGSCGPNGYLLGAGVGIGIASLVAGLIMINVDDYGTISVSPLARTNLPSR